ncbi:cobalamin biosynthesis protein CobW [Haloprofundus marisrubri]|uniref:Cobalamin biosynthesis protein CobW n=1 Tax=Haloprofundus marisrubri TaxID=1514971 RepID=A0A0W1RDD9_9EURY|nr:GTP-binding protein [Haloprofundus marisrubri]KTG11125.1 cobalamin biosynthesis protein CobW [Haloprofundus marisrubri]
MSDSDTDRIPVTVVSGYLGAGKTTLVNHVLQNKQGLEVAVVVNDMGEVNVDAELLADAADGDGENDEGVLDLSNGCICCELQGDLLEQTAELAETRSFDYLLVESSGISEPLPVARSFVEGSPDSDVDPGDYYRLDTTVSVVDAYGFWKEFDPTTRKASASAERPLADVFVDQIEFCDVLLLNKCDMVPDDELDRIESVIRELQPRADLTRTTYSEVDPERILGTGLFDVAEARKNVGWKRRLAEHEESAETDASHDGHDAHNRDAHDDHGEHEGHDHGDLTAAEAHGVSSFVYANETPFHPHRFAAWLRDWDGSVVRAKGFFLLGGAEGSVMGLSQAGPSIQAGPIGEWDGDDTPRTRLVFIGSEMDEQRLRAELDDCLVNESERTEPAARDDPFPLAMTVEG